MVGNPTWGDVYKYKNKKLTYIGNCIYKRMDYDYPNASYAEKIWSLLGKRVLKKCRVPEITLVKDLSDNEIGMLSHIILDNRKEDLIDMRILLFNKYERQELNKQNEIVKLDDLLECLRIQIKDDKNYREIETQTIETILLDSITNNADRHANNWCLIRDKDSNQYTVGLFDHSISFIDMISESRGVTIDGWASSYIRVSGHAVKVGTGDMGNVLIKHLFKEYPEISMNFLKTFTNEIEYFYKDLEEIPGNINKDRIRKNIKNKMRFIKGLLISYDYQKEGDEVRDEY